MHNVNGSADDRFPWHDFTAARNRDGDACLRDQYHFGMADIEFSPVGQEEAKRQEWLLANVLDQFIRTHGTGTSVHAER